MKITLVLACLGVATFAATAAWLSAACACRRLALALRGPAGWIGAEPCRPEPAARSRNRPQRPSIPHRRAAA